MARIRSIKPEFWTSEQVADCSTTARLLFIGLWTFSDDGGVHPASCKRAKMEIFPGDPFTEKEIEAWVDQLIENGLIVEFSNADQQFWAITGWKHQKIEKPNIRYNSPTDVGSVVERSSNGRREVVDSSPPDRRDRRDRRDRKGEEGEEGERGAENDSTPPPGDASPVFITIPTISGNDYPVTEAKIAEWQETYPAVDVPQKVRTLRQWCIDNPGRRKTEKGMNRFLSGRLSEEQDRGPHHGRANRGNSGGHRLSATERVDAANGGPGYPTDSDADREPLETYGAHVRPRVDD